MPNWINFVKSGHTGCTHSFDSLSNLVLLCAPFWWKYLHALWRNFFQPFDLYFIFNPFWYVLCATLLQFLYVGMSSLCVSSLCMSTLFLFSLRMSSLCISSLCVSSLCMPSLCVSSLCMSSLYVSSLCMSTLSMSSLCMSLFSLYVQSIHKSDLFLYLKNIGHSFTSLSSIPTYNVTYLIRMKIYEGSH